MIRQTRRLLPVLIMGVISLPGAAQSPTEPGHPQAPAFMALVNAEVDAALARVDGADAWGKYHDYINKLMDDSAGEKSWSDKTGNCRLTWVDHLIRNPIAGVIEAEAFTREVHVAASDPARLGELVSISARVTDVAGAIRVNPIDANTPEAAIEALVERLGLARQAVARAFAPLNEEEMQLLRTQMYPVTTGRVRSGSRFADRNVGRQITDVLEKVDRHALHEAAATLVTLTNAKLHAQWLAAPATEASPPAGVSGGLRGIITTEHGLILIGDTGPNEYDLDAMANVICVIDLGGDDVYREGTLSGERPILVIIDLAGNDTYSGEKPGIQGGAILGASLLYDVAGDDKYEAQDISQGAALAGVGILIDDAGNDTYKGLRRTQGSAICGLAVLIDRGGDDRYRAALLAQGVGGPLGFGLLEDVAGDDEYYAGGLYPSDYNDTPGHSGWSQGIGVGPRGVANGGIGVLLDGGGDDLYECDYFSHAGGYWFAAGFARDFAGNDQRIGATRTAYDGSERQPTRFTRWGIAFGCHFANGYLFDDEGDDLYQGQIVGIAFAWDFGVTVLCDFAGNDHYEIPGTGSANALEAGVAILFDAAGDDSYHSGVHGVGAANISYHPTPDAGGNFAFAIDYGGQDQYPGDLQNNTITERGVTKTNRDAFGYGFVIDRAGLPTADELRR